MARKKISPSSQPIRIVAICQVYNELSKGNLERFIQHIKPLVHALIIYDDASTDGSYEYALQHADQVIRGTKNSFSDEIYHKQQLLDAAKVYNPDFILHIDADEVLSVQAMQDLPLMCQECLEQNIDGVRFHTINLWRSNTWRRIDSLFDDGWFVKLWRYTPGMSYGAIQSGLHQMPYPPSIQTIMRTEKIQIIHYGFASEEQIAAKYLTYKSHGQRGYTMLDRLINEDKLELVPVPKSYFPPDLWVNKEPAPLSRTPAEALTDVEFYKSALTRPKFSIVCLIYKSVDWLKFVHQQVLKYTDMTDKEFFFVANDATEPVLQYLRENYLPYQIFNPTAEQKKEWYINNVYRAWNFGASQAQGDFIVFINSDMAFSPGWFEKLWSAYDGTNCLASRLVESGKLRSGQYGIEKNFGTDYSSYQEDKFQAFAATASLAKKEKGGLFMPLLIRRSHFLEVGGYPKGNVVPGSDPFKPKIATKGAPLISGDVVLMDKLKTRGITHQTVFDSLVYHFQEGEMDSSETVTKALGQKQVAICNDLVTGRMGEKVLWDFMLESLPATVGVDERVVGTNGDMAFRLRNYLQEHYPEVPVIIQNASFIGLVDAKRYTIAFLQDDLRSMGRNSVKQERNLKLAQKVVANSVQTALSYSEYDFEIIPVGTDTNLFHPMNKTEVRQELGFGKEKIAIFVGNFSEVKGWPKVKACIAEYPDITWILVSKYNETYEAANVRVYNRVQQDLLAKLLNCADFFIIGSPVETQCLAAIEACCCDVPVVMPLVGIFRDWSEEERTQVGIFGDDLAAAIKEINRRTFHPRDMIFKKKLTVADSMAKWQKLLERAFQEKTVSQYQSHSHPVVVSNSESLLFSLEYAFKYRFLRRLFRGKDITLIDFIIFLRKHLPDPVFFALRSLWLQTKRIKLTRK